MRFIIILISNISLDQTFGTSFLEDKEKVGREGWHKGWSWGEGWGVEYKLVTEGT